MANTNQPDQMPKPGQGQQQDDDQRHQEQQPGRQGQPMPKVGQGHEGMGGRKNSEEVGEPVQLPDEQQQPQRGGKDQQTQANH